MNSFYILNYIVEMAVINWNLYDNWWLDIYTWNPKDYIWYSCIIKKAGVQVEWIVKEIKEIKEWLFCKLERYICWCKTFHWKFVWGKFIPKKCRKQYTRQPRLWLDFTCWL